MTSRKKLLLTENFFIISWIKFLHRVAKWKLFVIKRKKSYLLAIFHNFLNEVSVLYIQEVKSIKSLLLTYKYFHNFLNKISVLCIQEMTSRKKLLLTENFFIISWIKFLHRVSKSWNSWMKFPYCVSMSWLQERNCYLLRIFS